MPRQKPGWFLMSAGHPDVAAEPVSRHDTRVLWWRPCLQAPALVCGSLGTRQDAEGEAERWIRSVSLR